MITKTWVPKLVAAGGAVLALSLPVAAGAQTVPAYPGGNPPQVMSENLSREVPTRVLGESITRSSGGDTLPVTGGDIAGMVALGAGAIATGTVLVRRSRARTA